MKKGKRMAYLSKEKYLNLSSIYNQCPRLAALMFISLRVSWFFSRETAQKQTEKNLLLKVRVTLYYSVMMKTWKLAKK